MGALVHRILDFHGDILVSSASTNYDNEWRFERLQPNLLFAIKKLAGSGVDRATIAVNRGWHA